MEGTGDAMVENRDNSCLCCAYSPVGKTDIKQRFANEIWL